MGGACKRMAFECHWNTIQMAFLPSCGIGGGKIDRSKSPLFREKNGRKGAV